jgi:hypothetical protein
MLRKNIQATIKSQLKGIFSSNDIKLNPATMELLQGITPPATPKGQPETMDTKENQRSSLVTPVKPGQIIPTNSPNAGTLGGKLPGLTVGTLETERDQLVKK